MQKYNLRAFHANLNVGKRISLTLFVNYTPKMSGRIIVFRYVSSFSGFWRLRIPDNPCPTEDTTEGSVSAIACPQTSTARKASETYGQQKTVRQRVSNCRTVRLCNEGNTGKLSTLAWQEANCLRNCYCPLANKVWQPFLFVRIGIRRLIPTQWLKAALTRCRSIRG